jgi:hypothetical protein
MAAQALVFQDTTFNIVDRVGRVWLRASEIGDALGYKKAGRVSIDKLYKSNADEFTDDMTALIKLPDVIAREGDTGQMREVRVFNLRGAYLLAMFARTEVAKLFRKWILDVLEKETALPFNPQKDIQDELYRASGGKQSVRNELSRMLRDRFGVARYQDIPDHQCQAAVEYIRSLKVEVVNKPLAVITDTDKVRRAYAIAAEVASRASQTVFDAVMGDEDWCNKRLLFGITGNVQGQYVPYVMSIADNALIATIAELPHRILAADLRSSNKDIFDIATACNQKLAQRFSRMEQNALTKQ